MSREQVIRSLEWDLASLEHSPVGRHPNAISVRHNLAHAYRGAQCYDQAIVLFGRNVDCWARVMSAGSPAAVIWR